MGRRLGFPPVRTQSSHLNSVYEIACPAQVPGWPERRISASEYVYEYTHIEHERLARPLSVFCIWEDRGVLLGLRFISVFDRLPFLPSEQTLRVCSRLRQCSASSAVLCKLAAS